jgi:nuclear pore complex protein Nup155
LSTSSLQVSRGLQSTSIFRANFVLGAIQLALNGAARSDKANLAYSWIMDGRPEQVRCPIPNGSRHNLTFTQDPRKEYFLFRKQCYDLIFKVVLAVDALAASDPGAIDGQLTIIAKRKNEAYGVISDSTDEVFLTSLYDWYLEQGWSERLLQTQSLFVVTYLQRKSNDDLGHADLLWKYYAQSERFFEAAQVQFHLANSAFSLPLSPRIEYLGQARANASIFTPDVGRQSRQRLLQEISNLIDVANIQDDLLQRLKDDVRIVAERKAEVLKEVDGPIMDISTVSSHREFRCEQTLTQASFSINTPTQPAITTSVSRSSTKQTTATQQTSSQPGNT